MVDATGIVTNGLWTTITDEVVEPEIVYITQLDVEISIAEISVAVEIDV